MTLAFDGPAVVGALAALDKFMRALNAGDEAGVNDAFNFPHVRLASDTVTSWEKRGDYKLERFYARAGEGWAESCWDVRRVIHAEPHKVHLDVQFSRWRRDGTTLGRFRSIWVVTNQAGHWGVQARSSFAA